MSTVLHQGMVPADTGNERGNLGDICRRYGSAYTETHALSPTQRKVLRNLASCRTAALGGQRQRCPACSFVRYVYHSCRNRHCPQCQATATADWVQARVEELLPVPYFHNVFTLPHELNPLALWSERNKRALWGLLMTTAAQTLLAFGRQEFGGQLGFTLVLHTWDQQLRSHFHVHALIAAGALAPDQTRWIAGGRTFLFPVHGLSKMFRAKYLAGVSQLLEQHQLDLPPQLLNLQLSSSRCAWLRQLRKKSWVIYSQPPFAGPRKLVDYLGRYTHRVAISNDRLLSGDEGHVRFTWRDRADGDRRKVRTLPVSEFLQRFLSHVLPEGFMRVRHYGFLANRGKHQRLAHLRQLLGARPPLAEERPQTAAEWIERFLGIDIHRCPSCGGPLVYECIPSQQDTPDSNSFDVRRETGNPHLWDTS